VKLDQRVVVITGAGAGIGRACAKEFAQEGARVVVADINYNGAQDTVREIEALGGMALAVRTDVADPASVRQGDPQPNTATLNDRAGLITSNSAVVPAGTSGSIDVFVTDATNVIIDINGYYAQPSSLPPACSVGSH
jgi:NAD(P)-dependent dehydrogenase (short-subunit alcohol dehydrogenase family)